MIAGLIALSFAAAFAGAAIYVNWVEQPARLGLDGEALLSEWGPSDSRGVALLLAFALASTVAGFIAFFETEDVRFVFGALIVDRELALCVLRHGAAEQPDPRAQAARTWRRRGRWCGNGATSNPGSPRSACWRSPCSCGFCAA